MPRLRQSMPSPSAEKSHGIDPDHRRARTLVRRRRILGSQPRSLVDPTTAGCAAGITLLDAPPLEETGIGRVLPDVGGVALLGGVHFGSCLRGISARFGVVTGTLVTAVGGRYGRHFIVAGH